jgi:hypothetical protein
MTLHFQNLLESAVADLFCPIDKLGILGQLEQEQILLGRTLQPSTIREILTFLRCIAPLKIRSGVPRMLALIDGPKRITCREVERRANQVAY